MSLRESVELELAYVLHQRAYRNTSQLIECFTLHHGRVGLVAQGSRRVAKGSRALLQAFTPLRVSWIRRGELGRVVNVEAAAATAGLAGDRLLAGYYINELVLRLTARDDANTDAFSCYSECIGSLAQAPDTSRALRLFEYALLRALGYGIELGHDATTSEPIRAEYRYEVDLDGAPRRIMGPGGFSGRELISLRDGVLEDDESLRAAKRLLARALQAHLGGSRLRSRDVLRDILRFGLNA